MCSKSQGFYGLNSALSPAAQAVRDAARNAWSGIANPCEISAAAFRAAAAQMIKTGDLTDTAEDIIRGAERHHQAGRLCTMAAELEGTVQTVQEGI
jgi:hypothetical protein